MTLPDSLRIRRMAGQDLDAVMAIERKTDSAPHWSSSDYLALKQSDSDLPLKRNAMVAEVDGVVVGFAIVRLVGGAGAAEAELESIVVAEEWRGRGLARSLLSESGRQARELGPAGSIWRFGHPMRPRSACIGGRALRKQAAAEVTTTIQRRTLS